MSNWTLIRTLSQQYEWKRHDRFKLSLHKS
jgi:hypothetical protein